MSPASPALMNCPLCGTEFDRSEAQCSHNCPLDNLCHLTRCPHCNYEFPDERRYKGWWDRFFPKRKPAAPAQDMSPGALSLPQAPVGVDLELERLTCVLQSRRNSLSVYGLVPGSRLTLQQTQPTCVVRVGATELALDHDIAREVMVRLVR